MIMDIQFIQFNDTLPLTSVDEVPGLVPRSLQISGTDFRTAIEVDINGQPSPSFVVAAPMLRNGTSAVLIAQVPETAKNQPISSVTVVSSDFRMTKQSIVTFRFGTEPKKATGLKCLMQTYLKLLLTSTYYDAFTPALGGGALDALGANANSPVGANVVAVVTRAVSAAGDQMRALQARQTGLSADEKLLSANLLSCRYNASITGIDARVELIAQSGTMAVANLEV